MWVFEPIESVCIFHTLLFFHVWWTYVRCISRTCVTIFRNICHWLHVLENDRGIRFTTMAQITIFPKEKKKISLDCQFEPYLLSLLFLITRYVYPLYLKTCFLTLSKRAIWDYLMRNVYEVLGRFGKRISVGVFHVCIYYLKKKKRKERLYTKQIKSF